MPNRLGTVSNYGWDFGRASITSAVLQDRREIWRAPPPSSRVASHGCADERPRNAPPPRLLSSRSTLVMTACRAPCFGPPRHALGFFPPASGAAGRAYIAEAAARVHTRQDQESGCAAAPESPMFGQPLPRTRCAAPCCAIMPFNCRKLTAGARTDPVRPARRGVRSLRGYPLAVVLCSCFDNSRGIIHAGGRINEK